MLALPHKKLSNIFKFNFALKYHLAIKKKQDVKNRSRCDLQFICHTENVRSSQAHCTF